MAIVGGGFSGAALAVQLLRNSCGELRVTLLESGARLARGVAYATTDPKHLLNTRAGRMSLLGDDPQHFVRWCRAHGHAVEPTDFVARKLYGDYLESTLRALVSGVDAATFTMRAGAEVVDVAPLASGGFAVELLGGVVLHADEVVLATGHALPADPLARWLPAGDPRYVRDPWRGDALAAVAPGERVLLLGTGLTMIDVALTLAANAPGTALTAVSRRGLLPRVHGAATDALPTDIAAELLQGLRRGDLRRAVRAVRTAARAAERRGLHWQTAIDALRASTEPFWRALCAADRRRFVQRVRPYWDVHRHRLPPATAERIAAFTRGGQLRVHAARIRRAAATARGISVTLEHRRGESTARFDHIVNCTGPAFTKDTCRGLERRLLERGLLIADPLGLGFVTTETGIAFGARGLVAGLHVLGPACRSQRWEHTAVPELREQAGALAAALLARRGQVRPSSLRQR